MYVYNTSRSFLCIVGTLMCYRYPKDTMEDDMMQTLPACPVEATLTLIGNKWSVLILRDLMDGTKRFNELQKSIGSITQKVLTSNLRTMETQGLLERKIYAEVPPRVEYTLTDTGYSLKPVLDAMTAWGLQYKENHQEKLKDVTR